MNHHRAIAMLFAASLALGCDGRPSAMSELEPPGPGPHAVASTNIEVAPGFADIGDEAMHTILLGRADESGQTRFITDILAHPEAAWITNVAVPDEQTLYGPASGQQLSVVTFVTYPAKPKQQQNGYVFPYHEARYGEFEHMLDPGETPEFASADERYPLIILSHGAAAHGMYEVRRAQRLASHGYIVAVLNYGDERTVVADSLNHHMAFLRPLLTKAVLDSLLESETFGGRIDTDNIGISGHSFGGFTALAIAGGPYQGNTATVSDERITAGALAAPWVGSNHDGTDIFGFGPDNRDLDRVTIPMVSFFGTKDAATPASFILPAMKKLSGPIYVVELVDQPHIFEQGSWEDRDNWELLFFAAYLKHDAAALEMLKSGHSMKGGNEDVQLFDYQQAEGRAAADH